MDPKTGVFTVPINGTYIISFHWLSNSESGGRTHLILNKNILTSSFLEAEQQNSLSMSSIVQLEVGVKVSVELYDVELYDDPDALYTQFSGFLLTSYR